MTVICPNRDKCQSSVCHHRERHEKTADCTPGMQDITCDGKTVNVMVCCRAFPDSKCIDPTETDIREILSAYIDTNTGAQEATNEIMVLLKTRGMYDNTVPDSESPADLEPDSVPGSGDCGQVPEMESE